MPQDFKRKMGGISFLGLRGFSAFKRRHENQLPQVGPEPSIRIRQHLRHLAILGSLMFD